MYHTTLQFTFLNVHFIIPFEVCGSVHWAKTSKIICPYDIVSCFVIAVSSDSGTDST